MTLYTDYLSAPQSSKNKGYSGSTEYAPAPTWRRPAPEEHEYESTKENKPPLPDTGRRGFSFKFPGGTGRPEVFNVAVWCHCCSAGVIWTNSSCLVLTAQI